MYRLLGIVLTHPIMNFALPKIMDEERMSTIENLVMAITDPTAEHPDRDIADWLVCAATSALEGDPKPTLELLEAFRDLYKRGSKERAKVKVEIYKAMAAYERDVEAARAAGAAGAEAEAAEAEAFVLNLDF